jgi:hypothetical protein
MTADEQSDDKITAAVLSGSTYEQVRVLRHSLFGQPLTRQLSLQGFLLALLGATVPLYYLFPASVETYLTATNPMTATPKVAMLGAFGGTIVFLSSLLLVGAALYRVEHTPLTESQARELLTLEDFTGGLTIGMGGLAILVTVLLFAMGLFGGDVVGSYVQTMGGHNPFGGSEYRLPLGYLGIASLTASAMVLAVRWHVGRLFQQL